MRVRCRSAGKAPPSESKLSGKETMDRGDAWVLVRLSVVKADHGELGRKHIVK